MSKPITSTISRPDSFTYNFDRNPLIDSISRKIEDLVNNWLKSPSVDWGKQFFSAANEVVKAEQNFNKALDKLTQLNERPISTDLEARLRHLTEIREVNHTISLNITIIYESIRKAQDIRHQRPSIFFRDGEIESEIDKVNKTYLKPLKNVWIGRYMQYVAQVAEQNNADICETEAYIHFVSPWPEFNKIREAIFKAGISIEERAALIEDLKKAQEQLSLRKEETLAAFSNLSSAQKVALETFTDNVRENGSVLFEEAQFYADSAEQNAEQIRSYRQQNRDDAYHRYSTLFAQKLLQEGDPNTCITLSSEWMKCAGKEASVENVLYMGNAHLAALQRQFQQATAQSKVNSPVDSQFYESFNSWIEAHPELRLNLELLKAKSSSDERTEAENVLLLQGYLAYAQKREPNYRESQCYQMCDQLDPAFHWKAKQGEFHISTIQFEASKKLIDSLPVENSHYLKQMHSWGQYRCACVALDVAMIALQGGANYCSKGNVKKTLQYASAATQFLSIPLVAKYAIPQISRLTTGFIDYPEELSNHPNIATNGFPWLEVFYLSRMVVPPIAKRLPIRVQEHLHLNTLIPVATEGMMVFGPIITGMRGTVGFTSLCSSVTQVGISGISLACIVWQSAGNRPSPTLRALYETAGCITTEFFPVSLIGRSRDVFSWVAKRVFPKLIPAAGTLSTIIEAGQIGTQAAIVAYQGIKKYPLRKEAHFLVDVQNNWLAGDYRKGREILRVAVADSDLKATLALIYLNCLPFFKLFHRLQETQESLDQLTHEVKNVDLVLEDLKRDNAYEAAYNMLFVIKMKAFIKCGETQKLKRALIEEKPTESLKEQLLLSQIVEVKSMISQQKYAAALKRLDMLIGIQEFQNYQPLLAKYQEYTTVHRDANPITPETPPDVVCRLTHLLDELVSLTTNKLSFSNIDTVSLYQEKVSIYLSAKKYEKAKEILDSWTVSHKIYGITQESLFQTAWAMGETGNYQGAHRYLQEIYEGLKGDQEPFPTLDVGESFLSLAANYFLQKHEFLKPNSPESAKTAYSKALNEVIQDWCQLPPQLEQLFQFEKAIFLIQTKSAAEVNLFLKQQRDPLGDQITLYFFQKIYKLCKEQKFKEALDSLTCAASLELEHKSLIEKYRGYITLCSEHKSAIPTEARNADQFIRVIGSIISQIPEVESFSPMKEYFTQLHLYSYLVGEEYREAKVLISQSEGVLTDIATSYLSDKIFSLMKEEKYETASVLVRTAQEMIPSKHILFALQNEYVALCREHNRTLPISEVDADQFIRAIDPFLAQVPLTDYFLSLQKALKQEKLRCFIIGKRYRELNDFLETEDPTYHHITAILLLGNANLLISQNKQEEALKFIEECCRSIVFNHTELLIQYANYLNYWKSQNYIIPDQKAAAAPFIQTIDRVLNAIPNVAQAEGIKTHLKYYKLITYINTESYNEAKFMLDDELFANQINSELLIYLIKRAELMRTRTNYNASISYIDRVSIALRIEDNKKFGEYKRFLKAIATLSSSHPESYSEVLRTIKTLKNEWGQGISLPYSLQITETNLYCRLAEFQLYKQDFQEAISLFESALTALPNGHEEFALQIRGRITELQQEFAESRR